MKKDANYLKKVREQYESYPYPCVNPEDEKTTLHLTILDCLDGINHFNFGGKRNFYEGGRFLIAGGGTGHATIFLAEQLRGTKAEVVYLDMSQASMDVAKERARIRKLDNIKWVHASILDIPKLKLGKFDYINCTGVLHHLENPNSGLDALASVLKDDGTMGIMVYGKYGRTPLYQVQEMMALINIGEEDMQVKVDNCRAVVENFPSTHLFNSVKNIFSRDLKTDVGLYDMFLHSQDRAYSVIDLYNFAANSGLKLNQLFKPRHPLGNDAYNPECYIKDARLLRHVKSLNPVLQQAIAESMNGVMIMHDFSLVKNPIAVPKPDDLDLIPSLSLRLMSKHHEFLKEISVAKDIASVTTIVGVEVVRFKNTPNSLNIFKYLDGNRTTREIFEAVRAEGKDVLDKDLLEEFKGMFRAFNNYNSMFLRDKSVPQYRSALEMGDRVVSMYRAPVNG